MSEETQIEQQEKPEKPTQSYISRVRLKGYKSIIDTEVTFKPGLNIIIGANGSGKTNFVEFLANLAYISFFKSAHECEISGVFSDNYNFLYKRKVGEKIFDENREIFQEVEESLNIKDELPEIKIHKFYLNKIPHVVSLRTAGTLGFVMSEYGIPKSVPLLDNNLSLEGHYDIGDLKYPSLEFEANYNFAILINEYIYSVTENIRQVEEQRINKSVFFLKGDFYYLIEDLKKYSPIKDLKIDNGFSFETELQSASNNSQDKLRVNFLKLQFFVNDEWLFWSNLSDGTKRLFYIITNITLSSFNTKHIIEEPELGIHPHQLIRLMDFIKEQSETKQIIITTHSPEVLNTLKMDELDRIIVARYDKEKGTQMSHLSEDDIEHARSYMKDELFLSDYWVMSGFETEEETV